MSLIPPWLRSPDPSIDLDYPRRARLAYPSMVKYQSADQPLPYNDGFGDGAFTVEDACEWAERRCAEELVHESGWD